MKTLKQLRKIQEADADDYVVDDDDDEEALDYQPRSDGEIEFVDLHSVEVSNHPIAPEDQHVGKTSHNKHKGAEHPGEPVVKQGTSGDVKFAKFREKITKTPLRKGDKSQGDIKAGSVKEEVEFIEEAEQVVTLPKGVGFYDTTKYPIGGKFDRVTDSNGLKVTVKRRFKLYKGTDTEGMTSDGKKVAFQMRLAKEEVELDEAKKVTKKQLRDLEDRNEHGLVALKLAQSFGTPAEVKKIQDINKRHNMKGHIEYKDQKERDAIASKYWKMAEEVELGEGKSGTGYDLYHKDFSSAMKHAYDFAKRKYGITISDDEIDDKVATGPRKPSEGKTNSYRLKGDKGAIQVQVYNKGGSKPFELNMYKEEVEFIEEAVKAGTIKLENGKSIKVTKEDADAFNAVLKELNPENRKRMESEMMKDEKSYKNMLTFAKRTV